MQSSQHTNKTTSQNKTCNSPTQSPPFSPFLANTLKSSGNFIYAFVSYCQKHNMIIICDESDSLNFYDATTLLPLKKKNLQKLNGFVPDLSCSHEDESIIIGRKSGSLYIYNTSTDQLKKLREHEDFITTMAFLDSPFYAFSLYQSGQLYIGTFSSENIYKFPLKSRDTTSLCYLQKSKILLVGSDNGSVRTYRTNRLPFIKVLCSVQTERLQMSELKVQGMKINGKEFIITSSVMDKNVKIWHFIKGRMRLLRVIQTEGVIDSFVCLENYKMIAIACEEPDEIGFFNVLSGKLETMFVVTRRWISSLFLMKDRNMIGGVGETPGLKGRSIKLIQLHPQEHPKEKTMSTSGFVAQKINEIKGIFKKLY